MIPTKKSLFMSSLAAWTCWCGSAALPMVAAGTITLTGAAFAVAGDVVKPENTLVDYGIVKLVNDETKGVAKIEGRTDGSAAQLAGIVDTDEVTLINDLVWKTDVELKKVLKSVRTKEVVKIKVNRVSDPITVIDIEHAATFVHNLGLVFDPTKIGTDNSRELIATFGTAAGAGLRTKDEVLKIDDVACSTVGEFNDRLCRQMLKAGKVKLTVRQKGNNNLLVEVTLSNTSSAAPSINLVRGVGDGSKGPPIDFPEFIATGTNKDEDIKIERERANEVVSARVETYYFRDAHRLAQIINRKIQSYNGAAVTAAERAAEAARGSFEKTRLDRRDKEDLARVEAEKLQDLEARLAGAVGTLRTALHKKGQIDILGKEIADLQKRITEMETNQANLKKESPPRDLTAEEKSQLADLKNAKNNKETQQSQLENEVKFMTGSVDSASATVAAKTQVTELLTKIDNQKTSLNGAQATARKANDEEQLAAKDQFRKEVTAAKTDPDTYVPGNLKSIDPVSQVSISVIGEGVVHLRGPRKGVVKVRDMIDQLDHPVGQVKIGVMTVQVNGELGSRMENTLKRVEGNISKARFLTSTSGQLFLRAVHEVAHERASRSGMIVPTAAFSADAEKKLPAPPAYDAKRERWERYLQAFFGADFIEELRDIDTTLTLLNPDNKLLSLNSMDTLTLAEAMFVVGLAKGEVRDEILARFQEYVCYELPRKEGQWIVTTGTHKSYDPRWWGDAYAGRARVAEQAQRKYAFEATKNLFVRRQEWGTGDRMSPMQHAVVKLVQGISVELALNIQRDAIVSKRAMIERLKKTNPIVTDAQMAIVDEQITDLEEKHLGAKEALRGQKAAIDKLIKQAVTALEEDVYAQFYDPALENVRKAAQDWDVELAQIERTTILTNNRAFGKVTPQATFEFDLPKRDILLAEALQSAYALHKDIGPLLADPEFATLAKMFAGKSVGGAANDGTIKNVLPALNGTDQQNLLYADKQVPPSFTTELDKLIPDPAVYKFETGTGYEVRPVVQPDGQSVAFDFNYLYTTDLLEPTRANEKHLGRVKRHFINTEVQLGNLEWREISRYEVALKAARTARGVPLLEDVPVAGLLFRPLPQAQKSIQKNVIIGQATIFPTVQDLLGLRPANQAYMDHQAEAKNALREWTIEGARFQHLNEMLDSKMQQIVDGECPNEVKKNCPPAMTTAVPTGSNLNPRQPQTRISLREGEGLITPRPVTLPEIPAPTSSPSESIQQMSYQKPTAKVKSAVPAAPAAPRRVK